MTLHMMVLRHHLTPATLKLMCSPVWRAVERHRILKQSDNAGLASIPGTVHV